LALMTRCNGVRSPASAIGPRRLRRAFTRANRVYVEGNLKLNTWEKDGEKRAGLSVAGWKVEKLGRIGRNRPPKPKGENREEDQPLHEPRQQSASAAQREWQRPADRLDQPIPFAPEVR
jgi:single-stranded DNA-binding protein